MNPDPHAVESLILESLRALLPPGSDPAALNAETVLFGPGARLDSMGLVTLVVDVEQQLQASFGWTVTLADDRAMSQRHSPFRTVGTLRDYALQLARERPNA